MVRRGIVAGFRGNGIIRRARVHDPVSGTTCFSLGPIILVVEMIKVSGRHAHDARDAPLDDRAAHALVASFQASSPCASWSWWQASVAEEGAAVRTTRGTPRQRVGRQAHDHHLLSSCAPEVDGLHTSVFAPPTARGEADAQTSQPVQYEHPVPRPPGSSHPLSGVRGLSASVV